METMTNYWLLWTIYLCASAVFFVVFWRMTRFRRHHLSSYMLRAVALAFALTPWYANQEGTVLAPALMIVMMDAITIGGDAAVRSVVPLFLALILAAVIAGVCYFIGRKNRNKDSKNTLFHK